MVTRLDGAPDASGELVRPLGRATTRTRPRFGHQPGLDGLRALSVAAVICYHAGFSWMHGGWVGVEVFFVVSGFLITSLLIDERERRGDVRLGQFWLRRARRLLPALLVVLATVAAVVLVAGTAQQRGDVRRDVPWALAYLGNWGQIVGGVPYYGGDPSPLRHVWSLAIEEQFYLVWPLAFAALARTRLRPATIAAVLVGLAVTLMAWTWWLHAGTPSLVDVFGGVDRVNFMYLSTPTRATGLLLGCAAAFVWRPWRRAGCRADGPSGLLDIAGGVSLGLLGCVAGVAVLTAGYVYQWLLPAVSVLGLVVVLVTVHPDARATRTVLSWAPLVAIGRRSYGLYLWHWPVFVLLGARHGSMARFVVAMAIAAALSEVCYRRIELPVRRGALGAWWRTSPLDRPRPTFVAAGAVVVLVASYVAVNPYDRAAGGVAAEFIAPTPTVLAPLAAPVAAPPPVVHIAVVGDSQAHALVVNAPDGLDATFDLTDGSVDGCSVYDEGRVRSQRASFRNYFQICAGWQRDWAAAVQRNGASIALVVLGAWDVFDLETDEGTVLTFGTPAWDAYVRQHLETGIEALRAAGAHVALLEIPCMRPISVEGAAVPPLPERGDDRRVAHVNDLFRSVAAADPAAVTFVPGPAAWCGDESIATDVGMRWDGVHVYKPGAKLVFDTIAPALLAM